MGYFWKRAPEKIEWRWEIIASVTVYATGLIVGGHYFAGGFIVGDEEWRTVAMGMELRLSISVLHFHVRGGTSAVAGDRASDNMDREGPGPMSASWMPASRANRVKCTSNLRRSARASNFMRQDHREYREPDLQQLISMQNQPGSADLPRQHVHEKAIGATTEELAENANKDSNYRICTWGKGW